MKPNSKILSFIILALLPHSVMAQTDPVAKKQVQYYNTFVSGFMIGCNDCEEREVSFSLLTTHGVKLKSGLKLAAGIGFDTYRDWQTVPFVGGLTIDRERRKMATYVQLNAGHSWARYIAVDREWFSNFSDDGGFIFNPMIGWRMSFDKVRLYWQAGYKFQRATVSYSWWSGNFSRRYDLNRFVVQLGFGFN